MTRRTTCILGLLCAQLFLTCWAAKGVAGENSSFPEETRNTYILDREKRQLLFPNTTMVQIGVGVTVPTPVKDINCNWAFQTNFQLPWNRTQIPTDIFLANTGYDGDSRVIRAKREIEQNAEVEKDNKYLHHQPNQIGNDTFDRGLTKDRKGDKVSDLYGVYNSESRLLHLYQGVEKMLESFGYEEGSSCILRTLCQLAKEPLYADHDEDLLHELAAFVLNPNNELHVKEGEKKEMDPYLVAFARGRAFQDCTSHYTGCSLNIVDLFTTLRDN